LGVKKRLQKAEKELLQLEERRISLLFHLQKLFFEGKGRGVGRIEDQKRLGCPRTEQRPVAREKKGVGL
jgi:hypothetical protein